MKKYIIISALMISLCSYSVRNPFAFAHPKQTHHIIGRGIIHGKQCEAYTDMDGSIKIRWVAQKDTRKKSPST